MCGGERWDRGGRVAEGRVVAQAELNFSGTLAEARLDFGKGLKSGAVRGRKARRRGDVGSGAAGAWPGEVGQRTRPRPRKGKAEA